MDKQDQHTLSPEIISQSFWARDAKAVLGALLTSPDGLDDEAITVRRKIFGHNEITDRGRTTRLRIILNQVKSPLILILVGAGFLTILLREWTDAAVILAAVLANTAFGFWQENKAEQTLTLLHTYVRTRTRVRRDGKDREIDAAELVPGDIIRISRGDRVPADARLLSVGNLEVDEAVLTGESLPVGKDIEPVDAATPLAERQCMIMSGTLVVEGFGDAVITTTGDSTEFGKIAGLIAANPLELTPLQRSIASFARSAGAILLSLVLLLFLLGVAVGRDIWEMFLIAVAVAVSAIPEGLPVALTIVLAIGVQRLASKRAIVRRLLAAETLGSATLILTDKTGTLTQANMELVEILPVPSSDNEGIKRTLVNALHNVDVILENPTDAPEHWRLSGRALEVALVKGAGRRGVLLPEILRDEELVDRTPFNSERKFSVAAMRSGNRYFMTLLGAPEILLESSDVSEKVKQELLNAIETHARSGGRVLGVASQKISGRTLLPHDSRFRDIHFEGLLVFRDPLRPGIRAAIAHIAAAGVSTVMVTGDHAATAEAIAREAGLIDGMGGVMTGQEMARLSAEEFAQRAAHVSVYARVTSPQKVDIVKFYQKKGEIVAVTGDGVNDAPALKAADIGVAVGSGTDVAKNAADLVILDDNFETIVAAIAEGRKILDNIRKVVAYLLSNSFDELFLIGGSLLLGIPLPLTALQILFVNFFSDSFPAIAFAFEDKIDDLGRRPRNARRHVFDRDVRVFILVVGAATSAFLFALYSTLLWWGFPYPLVSTFIFASFSTYTLFLSFALRSLEKSMLTYNPFSNPYLNVGVGIGLVLSIAAVYLPFFQRVFGTIPLPFLWAVGVGVVGLLNITATELAKFILHGKRS